MAKRSRDFVLGVLIAGVATGAAACAALTFGAIQTASRLYYMRFDRTLCSSNVREIGFATLLYHSDYQVFPESPEQLLDYVDREFSVFRCPENESPEVQDCLAEMIERDPARLLDLSDYVLIGGFSGSDIEDASQTILAYERWPIHDRERGSLRYVFFADGHAEYLSAERTLEGLQATSDALRRAREREAEEPAK
jgi:hypothetical protein